MMTSLRNFRGASLARPVALAAALAAGACSLVNGYDDVRLAPEDPSGAGYGGAAAPLTPGPEGGLATPEAGATPSGPARPVVVLGGEVDVDGGGRAPALGVLDPETGLELGTREALTVAAVAFDSRVAGDDADDLWFVFESSGHFVPSAADRVTLHVRKLDTTHGTWTELQTLEVPTLAYYDAVVVLDKRLAFVAHEADEAGTGYELVVLDTTVPSAVRLLSRDAIAELPLGITGAPLGTGAGGVVNLFFRGACAGAGPAGRCDLEVASVLVPTAGGPQPAALAARTLVGPYATFGAPAYGTVLCPQPSTVVVLPTATNAAEVVTFDSLLTGEIPDGGEVPRLPYAGLKGVFLRRLAVDDASRVVFAVEANADLSVHAIPLDGGTAVSANTLHSGQAVYFEPGRRVVLAPFNQGAGNQLSAYAYTAPPAAGLAPLGLATSLRVNVVGTPRKSSCR